MRVPMFVIFFVFAAAEVIAAAPSDNVTFSRHRTITIPFSVQQPNISKVDVLYSKDRGTSWKIVAGGLSPAAQKLTFQADSDGEYWFVFQTYSATGQVSPLPPLPQLRVIFDTSKFEPPQQSVVPGAVTPPKPAKYRPEKTVQIKSEQSVITANKQETTPVVPLDNEFEMLLPSAKPKDALLADLELDTFFQSSVAVQAEKTEPAAKVAANVVHLEGQNTEQPKPGKIMELSFNPADKRQIVVKWNTGDAAWSDAQIDVLRSSAQNGPWQPISINLPNKGKYWWFLSDSDLQPFFVQIRLRSADAGTVSDTTEAAFTVNPALLRR